MSNLREADRAATCGRAFVRNQSDRLKRALAPVEVTQSPSLLLEGMVGSRMPVRSPTAGRVEVRDSAHLAQLESKIWWRCAADNFGKVTETYPAGERFPNGITATSESGRDHHDASPGTRLPHRKQLGTRRLGRG